MAGRDSIGGAHLSYFESTWPDGAAITAPRFVVLDSETTGLNPRTDRIVTIGAIAVRGGEIVLEDQFEALLKLTHNTSAVTVHGVTCEDSQRGLDEPEALIEFVEYLKDGIIVGHHIGHDVQMLNAACERHFGFSLRNRSLDTMDLTLHLEQDGAFAGQEQIRSFSLDALCAMFEVTPHDRHTAAGDAFLTALIFLRLLRLAAKQGRDTLGRISERFEPPNT